MDTDKKITDLSVFMFVLVAIILGNANMISLGALALVINSGVSVSH